MPAKEHPSSSHRDGKPDFTSFFRDNRNKIHRTVRVSYSLLSHAEVEDVVAETFAAIWPRYATIRHPKTYAYQVASRKAALYLRRRVREETRVASWEELDAAILAPSRDSRDDFMTRFQTIVAPRLTRRERAFLRLTRTVAPGRTRPYTLKEVADLWGYTYGAMRQYASRLRAKMIALARE